MFIHKRGIVDLLVWLAHIDTGRVSYSICLQVSILLIHLLDEHCE
jgi:hypothetical protein